MPPLLVMLMRLSLALTTLLLVLAAPSARALSVRALRLLRLLGPLEASPGPRRLKGPGLLSVMSLAMLIADTCRVCSEPSVSRDTDDCTWSTTREQLNWSSNMSIGMNAFPGPDRQSCLACLQLALPLRLAQQAIKAGCLSMADPCRYKGWLSYLALLAAEL